MNRYLHIIVVESFIYTFTPGPEGKHVTVKEWLDLSGLGNYVVPPMRVFLHQPNSLINGVPSKGCPTLFVCYKNSADNISDAISNCFAEVDLFLNHLSLKYVFGFTPLFDKSINVDCSNEIDFDITDLRVEFEENTVKSYSIIDRTTAKTKKINLSSTFLGSAKKDEFIDLYYSFFSQAKGILI